jgi:hypothetical protein
VDPGALRPPAPWDMGHKYPFPALRRLMVKTPEMAKLLPPCLGARPGTRYVEASGATWSGRSSGRMLVALDPGGDLSNWKDLRWVDKATGETSPVTTDPEKWEVVILETLDERAIEWSRDPRSEPIDSLVIDPDLVAYPGHVSGVIDADADGLGDLARRRPLLRDANRLGAVQTLARRMGKRAFADLTGLPPTVAERAAAGRPISPGNVAKAIDAMRAGSDIRHTCAHDGCDQLVARTSALYCSPAHAARAYRKRKKTRPRSPDPDTAHPLCPACGAVLLGLAAKRGRCRDCNEVLE